MYICVCMYMDSFLQGCACGISCCRFMTIAGDYYIDKSILHTYKRFYSEFSDGQSYFFDDAVAYVIIGTLIMIALNLLLT